MWFVCPFLIAFQNLVVVDQPVSLGVHLPWHCRGPKFLGLVRSGYVNVPYDEEQDVITMLSGSNLQIRTNVLGNFSHTFDEGIWLTIVFPASSLPFTGLFYLQCRQNLWQPIVRSSKLYEFHHVHNTTRTECAQGRTTARPSLPRPPTVVVGLTGLYFGFVLGGISHRIDLSRERRLTGSQYDGSTTTGQP